MVHADWCSLVILFRNCFILLLPTGDPRYYPGSLYNVHVDFAETHSAYLKCKFDAVIAYALRIQRPLISPNTVACAVSNI